jgi:N6-adenosine-specific RNA methylase IME4
MIAQQIPMDPFGLLRNGAPVPREKIDQARASDKNKDRVCPGKYNIILADPPWRYANWTMGEQAKYDEAWAKRNGRSPYPVMTSDDIAQIPVADIAARDSILLMWVTDPKLFDSPAIIEAWGFEYKTVAFTWVKQNPKGRGFHFGLGYHTRSNPEMCLLATRGKGLRRVDNSVPQLMLSPRGAHSKKPLETYERIERLYGNVPRVELFARQPQPGWDSIGNEIDGQDISQAIEAISA